ncbi:MAG TPA: cytochrome c1 [Beijerinckiaceae bacterium]|nr:cytochrome c1 [Beijerinckiaceae bacterium]
MIVKSTLVAGLLLALGFSVPANAAAGIAPPTQRWSFQGPFGTFDRAQLQRGFQVYREVCASCHGLQYVAFRHLAQPGGPEFSAAQVRALAAEYRIQDGPNDSGDMFERPGRPADYFPDPYPNEQAAAAANGGKAPPDLSVMAKARTYERGFPWFVIDVFTQYAENGADYLYALMTGYVDPPPGVEVPAGGHYNAYYPGHIIAMPNPLSDGRVEYPKTAEGRPVVPETVSQYSRDVTAFMAWAAEPYLEQRKRLGFNVMAFLIVFAVLMYFTRKKVWASVGGDPVAMHEPKQYT